MAILPPPIRILPDDLANKIAAGEVVERPMNVVKELVENALDAGADEVEIAIENGGGRLIEVVDNGIGMGPEAMALSVKRHATSKISELADLFAIRTLGFRGEALPAIAAVSCLTLLSRPKSEDTGYRLKLEGGTAVESSPAAHAVGTTLRIEDLFFNTPARLKFLKTPNTEWSHILDYVSRAALANPTVRFRLSHNGKMALDVREQGDTPHRLSQIFDAAFAKEGIFFAGRSAPSAVTEPPVHPYALRGWLGFPNLNRHNASGLYFFVNGRPIRDRMLQHAVSEAYQGLVMKGRYPVAILSLAIPPEHVDVNVHPTKSEVRFEKSGAIRQWLLREVRQVLQSEPWLKPGIVSETPAPAPQAIQGPLFSSAERLFDAEPGRPVWSAFPPARAGDRGEHSEQAYRAPRQMDVAPTLPGIEMHTAARPSTIPYSQLKLIGQFHGTYILCECGERLVLIDQHAAHERIGFEALKAAYQKTRLIAEPLLLPLHFDLLPSDAAILSEHGESLEKIGIEVQHLGGESFALQAAPALLQDANWTGLISDLVEELRDSGTHTLVDEAIDDLLATIACHRQIRANQSLSREEMDALLKELGNIDFAYHCPHGRPAAVEISLLEIEKWFKRRL